MNHYLIELAFWILLLFFIGCLIGYLLRRWFRTAEPQTERSLVEPVSRAQPSTVASRPVEPIAASPAAVAVIPEAPAAPANPVAPDILAAPPAAVPRMERPRGLEEPRGGKPDELLLIRGIGPKNKKILHTLGFFHFDQIAAWTPEQIVWVDDHLKFNGRIGREEWVEQASLLAAGNEEEFERRFGPKRGK
jgi:predicted flap endonuclease-1-like 5' DNA nuclease